MKKCCSPKGLAGCALVLVIIAALAWGGKGHFEKNGAQAGAAAAITEVVGRTINSCQPVNLFVGESKVDLVNVRCVRGELAESPEMTAMPSAPTAEAVVGENTEEKMEE